MKNYLYSIVLVFAIFVTSPPATASPEVDQMSDIEVSYYAGRMSDVLDKIQNEQICRPENINCLRAEFARNGLSYDDKESVIKRVIILVGSIQ